MSLLDCLNSKLRQPAECIIRINDEEIDLYASLIDVSVQTSRNDATTASLNFESRHDEFGVWLIQDAGIFKPWARITISVAFGHYSEEVMRGYILQVQAEYPADGKATLRVQCQDDSIALDRNHRRKAWGAKAATSDQIIFNHILEDYALLPDKKNGGGQQTIVVNQDDTDITFLKDRAEANGYELIFSRGSVYFGPWRVDDEAQETIMLNAGKASNCSSFASHVDGHHPDAVTLDIAANRGNEVVQQTIQSNLPLMGNETADSNTAGLKDFNWRMSREGGADHQALVAKAQKKANEQAMKIKAEGELDGALYGHVMRVAEPVGVDGVGTWLGGMYYVDSVTHTFSSNGYKQQFKLLRNAYGDNLKSGIGSALSAII